MYIQVVPVIDHSVRNLCCRPYPGHDKGKKTGCPNFNHKEGCPPGAPLFNEIFDLNQPVYVIYHAFDLKAHTAKMKAANPAWSEAQLKCCLYWQNSARKQLTKYLAEFMNDHPDYHVAVADYSGLKKDLGSLYGKVLPSPPEAMGINITKTLAAVGIFLEWPPVNVAYQVALAGIKI